MNKRKTLLQQYADTADRNGRNFLSKEEELTQCALWQEKRDERALERLMVSQALLVIRETHQLTQAFSSVAEIDDVHNTILLNMQKAVEEYPIGKAKYSVGTRMVNAAKWQTSRDMAAYLPENPG